MIVRPPVRPIDTRHERFELGVSSAAEYLRAAWPELREASFEIGTAPVDAADGRVPRWWTDRDARRIVIFRLTVERMGLGEDHLPIPPGIDQRRALAESATFRAAAEYLGREPWELGGDLAP